MKKEYLKQILFLNNGTKTCLAAVLTSIIANLFKKLKFLN